MISFLITITLTLVILQASSPKTGIAKSYSNHRDIASKSDLLEPIVRQSYQNSDFDKGPYSWAYTYIVVLTSSGYAKWVSVVGDRDDDSHDII